MQNHSLHITVFVQHWHYIIEVFYEKTHILLLEVNNHDEISPANTDWQAIT